MIDWKLKNFTEEEQKEHEHERVFEEIASTMPKFISIRNEKPQDISGIKDIVLRPSGKKVEIKLQNSARKRPEDIVSERSLNIGQMMPAKEKKLEELRFFKPNSKKAKK